MPSGELVKGPLQTGTYIIGHASSNTWSTLKADDQGVVQFYMGHDSEYEGTKWIFTKRPDGRDLYDVLNRKYEKSPTSDPPKIEFEIVDGPSLWFVQETGDGEYCGFPVNHEDSALYINPTEDFSGLKLHPNKQEYQFYRVE